MIPLEHNRWYLKYYNSNMIWKYPIFQLGKMSQELLILMWFVACIHNWRKCKFQFKVTENKDVNFPILKHGLLPKDIWSWLEGKKCANHCNKACYPSALGPLLQFSYSSLVDSLPYFHSSNSQFYYPSIPTFSVWLTLPPTLLKEWKQTIISFLSF